MKYFLFFLLLTTTCFSAQAQQTPVPAGDSLLPVYPGGENALIQFIHENMRYPHAAMENGISGTVLLQFLVDENGDVTYIKVLKEVGGGCTEEAIRVVKLMPKWTPGSINGKPVPVYYNLPLTFQLANGKTKKKKRDK